MIRRTRNLMQWFADEFVDFLGWFATAFGDRTVRDALLRDMGLEPVDGDVPDADAIASQLADETEAVRAFAAKRAEDADAVALAATIDSILKLADLVTDIVDAARADGGARSRIELLAATLEVWALESMRLRSPVLYHGSRAVGAINEAAGTIDWAQLRTVLGAPAAGADEETLDHWQDEKRVFALSHAVGATLAALVAVLAHTGVDVDDAFELLYGWEAEPRPSGPNEAERVAARTLTLRVGGEAAKALLTLALVPRSHGGPGIVVAPGGSLSLTTTLELDDDDVPEEERRALDLGITLEAAAGVVAFLPIGDAERPAELLGAGSFGASLSARPRGGRLVLGASGGTRLELGEPVVDVTLSPDGLGAMVLLGDSALVVSKDGGDALVQGTLPDEALRIPFALGISYDARRGWSLEGGTGLAVTIPVQRSLLGFRVHTVRLALAPPGVGPAQALTLEASAGIGFGLGGFSASFDRIGLEAVLDWSGERPTFDLGFRPPDGIGLAVDIGVVKGGGYLYLDRAKGEYAGVLELSIARRVAIQAVAILTTDLPEGDGYALFVSISGRFSVALSSNFYWTGIGGMLGHNHGVAIDKLQAGLRTKALDDVLFPKDPIANAPRILATLRSIFPVLSGASLLGIVLELRWGVSKTVQLRLGVIVQRGEHGSRVTLLGQLTITAPDEKAPTAKIVLDFIGDAFWDDSGHRIAFDARLRDSKIAEFTLTGSASARSVQRRDDDGTEQTDWLVSIGGFHPRYKVSSLINVEAPVPKQDRVGFKAKKGLARMTFEAYLAASANSFQFGARLQITASKSGFTAEALVAFDVIVITEPCWHFVADIEGRAAIKKGSRTLMSVELRLGLSGPKPWHARGKVKFKVLFVKCTIGFDEQWGQLCDEELPLIELENLLAAELGAPHNWGGMLSLNGHEVVTFGERREEEEGVSHPLGSLEFRQQVLPLGIDLERVGRGRPSAARRVSITEIRVGGVSQPLREVRDQFAAGQYFDLSEDEKLSRPSFERFESGVAVSPSGAAGSGEGVARDVEYDTIELFPEAPDELPRPGRHALDFAAAVRAVRFSGVAKGPSTTDREERRRAPAITVRDPELFVAAGRDALERAGAGVPGSFASALQAARALGGRLQVVELHEVTP